MQAEQNHRDAGEPSAASRVWVVGLSVALLGVLALNAWLCDDAFITLRSAKNLVEGRGPVFNLGWRVQSYTHPAWMLLLALSWALTREAFWTTVALGLAVSTLTLGLGLRSCRGWAGALVCALGLASARAFVEFSTSGLENPLTHLIVVGGALLLLRVPEGGAEDRDLLAASALLAAAFLARPDALLLLAPLWIHVDRRARAAGSSRRTRLRAWALGAAPALAWVVFATLYYGTPLPNTALAKLGGYGELGPSRVELVGRGLDYLGRTAREDPVSFALVLAGVVVPHLPARVGAASLRPLARGSAAYLVYVVAIGGDFMAGRFLSASVVCGALALGRLRWSPRWAVAASLAWPLLALLGSRHPWVPDAGVDPPRGEGGIVDERSHYAAAASVMAWEPGRSMPAHRWRELGERGPEGGRKVVRFSTLGMYGFHADPELHVVDGFALVDPLLARLPPVRRVDWKAGHVPRIMPEGYIETLSLDPLTSRLRDEAVAELYADVVAVHHGPVFGRGRGAAMLRLASGRAAAKIDARRYHLAELVELEAADLRRLARPLRFRDAGVALDLRGVEGPLRLRLSPGQRYALIFTDAEEGELERRELELPGPVEGEPAAVELELAPGATGLHLLPLTMQGKRSLVLAPVRG